MAAFMGPDFLLDTDAAKALYHQHAAPLPIIDYHSHVSPREIAENRRYDDLAQLWLEADHYKWRLMRWCGIDEHYITGSAGNREKFNAFAAALPNAMGNPMVHWVHLELQRYFDCTLALEPATADAVWEQCSARLKDGLTARDILEQSRVEALCTTDDPADTLEWHRAITAGGCATRVLPTFRPEQALAPRKPGFAAYLQTLGAASGIAINSYDDLCAALEARLDFFVAQGCPIADVSFEAWPWRPMGASPAAVFARALAGNAVSAEDEESYRTALLLELGRMYAARGLVMQLRYGVLRNPNPAALRQLGPDTGFDCMITPACIPQLAAYLGQLENEGALPKTILYSLNPGDNAALASLAGAFQKSGVPGWVQHGSAWWFNDTIGGMRRQLETLAELGALGSFIGMLTDSRSFLSYTRHDYFRRVLCGLLGRWMEEGQVPYSRQTLTDLVQAVSYGNIKSYLKLGKR